MTTRKTAGLGVVALGLALWGAAPAAAAHLVSVEAHAMAATTPGTFLPGDCVFSNVSATETVALRWRVTLTFSDGSTAPGTGEEASELVPGSSLAVSVIAVVPPDAPRGPGIFTCHGDATVTAGENPGESEHASASAGFSVKNAKPFPR